MKQKNTVKRVWVRVYVTMTYVLWKCNDKFTLRNQPLTSHITMILFFFLNLMVFRFLRSLHAYTNLQQSFVISFSYQISCNHRIRRISLLDQSDGQWPLYSFLLVSCHVFTTGKFVLRLSKKKKTAVRLLKKWS